MSKKNKSDKGRESETRSKEKKKDNKKKTIKKYENIELNSHQIIPINHMKIHETRGLILYHSTGSGKTITALMAMYQFDQNIVIIGPKSSKKAFFDDIKKLDLDSSRFKFYTFTKIKNLIKDTNIDILSEFSVIIDEAHNLRNETTNNMMLISALELVKKIILLTATPVINYLNDLSVLINIIQNKAVLPSDIRTFNASYYDDTSDAVINKEVLIKKLTNCISYYDRKRENVDYPESNTIYIEVEMDSRQLDEYKLYMKKLLYDQDQAVNNSTYKIDFENINPKKKNFFLSKTRQLSNTLEGSSNFPKIQQIYNHIKNGPFPVVVYSNYLKNGVFALTPEMEIDSITYKTITGDSSNEKIDRIVDAYNKGKYQVLLITSAGSESLDLKNTRQIHIMEPHWNESRIKQVIGRVIRYKSHKSLPKSERAVAIYRWCSVFPKLINAKSADQYLIELSKKKNDIFNSFNQIIKEVAIENNQSNNKLKGGVQNDMSHMYIYNKKKYIQLKYHDIGLPNNLISDRFEYTTPMIGLLRNVSNV
jgi:superfamily II DNA or RNA helicase